MKRLLIFAITAFLLLAPCAQADAPFSGEYEQAYEWAISWWGRSPEQCTSIEKTMKTNFEYMGRASQPYPGYLGPCILEVAEGLSGCTLKKTMTHETGHLLGEHHSEDPHNVMYPEFNPLYAFQSIGCVEPSAELPPTTLEDLHAKPKHRVHRKRFHRNSSLQQRLSHL